MLKLEEDRERSKNKLYQHQQLVKKWFDEKYSSERGFSVGDLVLRWDKQHKDNKEYTKFQCFGLDLSLLQKILVLALFGYRH